MNETSLQELKDLVAKPTTLTFDESFRLVQECSRLLGNSEEDVARDLVIRALENFPRIPARTRNLWFSLVEAAGLYPYAEPQALSGAALLRFEYHASQHLPNIYLHREQIRISQLLQQGQSVILSAPTSFGKSLLIQEVVASRRYKNIVVVQPTLALLDETRKKLRSYSADYEMIVSTNQRPSLGRNVFLFTGERVVEYGDLPPIDFFVIDEFYKLSLARDDDRAITLNQALYLLLRHTTRFYLLGPTIKSISEELTRRTGAVWIRSDYATVAVDVSAVTNGHTPSSRTIRRTPKAEKQDRLFNLLATLKEPTLVYCSSPDKASRLALDYHRSNVAPKSRRRPPPLTKELADWIAENIHPVWALRELLLARLGFHHGALPRHLGSSLVDSFNAFDIDVLFCTSTLIEGVNTTARNVVLFDEAKGRQPIDYFDYKNIVGRSGRMKVHYVGKVFQLVKRPVQSELDVDVPLFSQATAPIELLVQMKPEDLDAVATARLHDLNIQDEELLAIVRSNSGITVQGQIALYNDVVSQPDYYEPLLTWTTIPTYDHLATVIELVWRYLLKPNESKGGVVSPRQLAFMALQYSRTRSIRALIDQTANSDYWRSKQPDEHERIQRVVHLVLNTTRQWFEYRLPRLLSTVSSLQELAFQRLHRRAGNYGYFLTLLEGSFLQNRFLATLLDHDVPASAVRKIEPHLREVQSWDQLVSQLRRLDLAAIDLLPYEERKLRALV